MKFFTSVAIVSSMVVSSTQGYAFISSSSRTSLHQSPNSNKITTTTTTIPSSTTTSLKMVDQNVLMGAGVAIAGLGAGIGLVAFTENAGERAKERGAELSDNMATKIAGSLMEDVEVSSVSDLGSLTSQLENALKESGNVDDNKMKEIELTEEEKKRIAEEADDGW